MDVPAISRARAKASRPSYRRGGLALGQVDWVEFSEDSVDLVGLRALLGDPVVLIEVVGESDDWVPLSAEQRAQALEVLPDPSRRYLEPGPLTIHSDGSFVGVPGELEGVTEFGAMQAEIEDLKARLVASVQQVADQAVTIETLSRENAQLKAKAAAKPPKGGTAGKAPKAPKAATPPASPAPAEEPAAPAAEAPASEAPPES